MEVFINLTIDELRDRYLSINPRKTNEDFYNEIILNLNQSPGVSGDQAINAYLNSLEKTTEICASTFPLIISVAYCLEAQWALFKDDRERAWSCVAEARYWCGSMLSKDEFELSIKDVERTTNINKAKKAAEARYELIYGKVKNTVLDLAAQLKPEGGWKSRRNASIKIVEKLKSNGELSPLTETQAQITIDGWPWMMPVTRCLSRRDKPRTTMSRGASGRLTVLT